MRLKIPGEPSRYHPTGKNDIKDTIAINIGLRFIETRNPKMHRSTINIPGVVIMFDAFSIE